MSDVAFSCPECSQHIACDDTYQGSQVQCPTCKNSIIVPSPPSAPSTPPAGATTATFTNSLPEPSRAETIRANPNDIWAVILDWIKSMEDAELHSTDAGKREVIFRHKYFGVLAKIILSGNTDTCDVLLATADLGVPADYKGMSMKGRDSREFAVRQVLFRAGLIARLRTKFTDFGTPEEKASERSANRGQGVAVFIVGLLVFIAGFVLTSVTPRFWYGALIVGGVIMIRGIWSMATGKSTEK